MYNHHNYPTQNVTSDKVEKLCPSVDWKAVNIILRTCVEIRSLCSKFERVPYLLESGGRWDERPSQASDHRTAEEYLALTDLAHQCQGPAGYRTPTSF